MNTWIYRTLMTVLVLLIICQIAFAIMKPLPQEGCINGMIMQQQRDMWVQKGLWPTHCMPIDKD